MTRMAPQKTKQLCFSLLTILLWAFCYIWLRMGCTYFSPFALTVLRFFASALTVLVLLPFFKVKRPLLRDLPLFILSALSAYSLYAFLMATGAQTVTASVSSFITALSPVLAPVFSLLLLKEHLSRLKWISVAVAGLGVGIMLFSDASFSIEPGVLWVLSAAVLFALYNIIQRRLLQRYDSFEVTAYSTILGAITVLPFLPKAWGELRVVPLSATLVVLLLGFVSVVAYLFWAMALKLAKHTSEVTNYMFLTPILTTALGFFALGELPPISTFIGGGLLLLGLLLTNFEPTKKEAAEPASEPNQYLGQDASPVCDLFPPNTAPSRDTLAAAAVE